MMDFNNKGNHNVLYNPGLLSTVTNSSTITNTSSNASVASSTISSDSSSDPYNMSFLTDNQTHYTQLMDDLSIIDNIYDTFGFESESSLYDKQVLDVARHVVLKQQVLDEMLQSETEYVNNLNTFNEVYALRLQPWLSAATDKDIVAKFKMTPAKTNLDTLFENLHGIAGAHSSFLKELKERVHLWGPTQLISDVFSHLLTSLTVYEPFLSRHADFVMVIDTLHQFPSFVKLLETTMAENKNRPSSLRINDIVHYIQEPLHRLSVYSKALRQLSHYSDPAHPDYANLLHISQKFRTLEAEWSERVQDCQSHLMVLEAARSIQACPILVTPQRRLLLFAQLIKVDLDDITLTSDIRMYFLYNDSLIYCKKQKENKKDTEKKLVYKGTLNLRGADIRQLAPSFCAKMCEVKKPLFRIGKKASDANSLPGTEAFGFELVTSEINLNAMSPLHQNYQSAMAGAGAPIRRRHIMRTSSKHEQKTWFETIRKAIAIANAQPIL